MYYDDVTVCIAVSCEYIALCANYVYTLQLQSRTKQEPFSYVLAAFTLRYTHTLSRTIFHVHSLSMRVLIVTGEVNSPRPALVLPATVMLYTVNGIRSVSRSELSLLAGSIVIISLPVCLLTV